MFPRVQVPLLVCILLMWNTLQKIGCNNDLFTLKMVHRSSSEAQEILNQKYGDSIPLWPAKGTREYHKLLHATDRVRHNRRLIAYESLYFSSGNQTIDYGEPFGWLHYALIDLGTPNTSFLVALDTGSDLLWVPCQCKQCAPTSASSYGFDKPLNVYRPASSKSSKYVTCASSFCETAISCKSKSDDCPYSVQYLSDNTSTSGILIEDVIHLKSGNHHGVSVETPVVFGCGQVQSGGFLDGGAPDGLLGLGFGEIAIPNTLAKAGLARNSFSMCFQPDSSGRIFFGDKGTDSQQTTAFLPINGTHIVYAVGLEKFLVGSTILETEGLEMLVDSGTSFTYLPLEVYTLVTKEFNSQMKQERVIPYAPWDFCYQVSNGNTQDFIQLPDLSLVFKGGGNFTIYSPIIGLYSDNGTLDAFCLAILEGEVAILGQNFMTSYQLVFDHEELKLGWLPADCYKLEEDDSINAAAPSSTFIPMKAAPSFEAPSQNAPAPSRTVPARNSSSAQEQTSGDSNSGFDSRPIPWYTTLTVLVVNQVFYSRVLFSM